MNQVGPLPEAQVLFIAKAVAQALDFAHTYVNMRGDALAWVHGRLKPHCIFYAPGTVKVFGFGYDPIHLSEVEYCRSFCPETAVGYSATARSDLFALGSVLFELCTQTPLATSTDSLEILMTLKYAKFELSSRLSGVGSELQDLLKSLLQRAPERRPASARAVVERIDAMV